MAKNVIFNMAAAYSRPPKFMFLGVLPLNIIFVIENPHFLG